MKDNIKDGLWSLCIMIIVVGVSILIAPIMVALFIFMWHYIGYFGTGVTILFIGCIGMYFVKNKKN